MPPRGRKRPAEPVDDYPDSSPAARPTPPGGRASPASVADEFVEGEEGTQSDNTSTQQLAAKLVRYALSCEYARVPLRRQDISTKVLGTRSRAFKTVFDQAQEMLQDIFGMEMVELEKKEKVTISQKRAAQMSQNASKSSGQWVLRTLLPKKYLIDTIISPPRVPTMEAEAEYVGLYTMIVSLILLAGGSLQEAKLDRHLRRMNADQNTSIGKTAKVLAQMCKDNYIIKVKENQGGEETIDYVVGPRGKAEVGSEGVMSFVKTVYGEEADEQLDERLTRSLDISERNPGVEKAAKSAKQNGAKKRRGRPPREPTEQVEEEESEDEDE